MVDLSQPPYLDRFNPRNSYNRLLYTADKPLQNSELNEAQSILHHHLGRIGDAIMVDGDVLEDCDYHIDGANIVIERGFLYLGGKVRAMERQSMPFNNEGTFKVCVYVDEDVITSEDDPNLLDQTAGVESYLSSGADRLREVVRITDDDSVGVPIYEFRDGDLFLSRSENRELTRINEILAERTFDNHGSYKVRGFDIYSEQHPSNQNQLNIVVDGGRAYVQGFMVDKPTPTRIPVSKARDLNEINSEAFWYNNSTRRGQLGNSPVAEVKRVTAQVQVTRENVSRGATSGSSDSLNNGSVASVVRVWREENGETVAEYQQGRDFQLVDGNAISWAPSGNEPPAGGTYYVTYIYNKTMEENTDYRIVTEGSVDSMRTFIDFNGTTGNRPVPDSMVLVDYDYYLAREDLIMIDREGEVYVQTGQPDSLERVKKPNPNDPYMLILGSIVIYPNSTTTVPHKSTIKNLTYRDLQNMKNRIENLEYNQAINALDQPAMADANPATLRGVFSDGFISMSKYDSGHPDARIGFSFEEAQITLPYANADKKKPAFLNSISQAHSWGRLVTAPFEEELVVSQTRVTESMNINPYHVFNNQGLLKLDPSEDSWIEEEKVTIVEEGDAQTLDVRRWWGSHRNDPWVEDELEMISNITLDEGYDWQDSNRAIDGSWRHDGAYTGTRLEDGGQRTVESKIEFMRQIDINFEAENLRPNSNNLMLNFDGQRVPITPASGFNRGAENGTIMSNSQGEARGSFRIPSGVRTGVREVSLENADNIATTTFVAEGTHKRVEDVILRTRVTINMVDPLAQSFQFRENRIVTSFEVFFASVDPEANVTVQVRGITAGGQPNKTIHAETLLKPSDINVSETGTVPTKIAFDDPLVCDAGKEYCIVFLTDSDGYTMWLATRGQDDLNTGRRVIENPYLTGVLYSSSNASAWTVHQDSDLTFNIYAARFNDTAVLQFDAMEDVSADAIVLMATELTPQNTGCVWDVKIVMDNEPQSVTLDDKPWVPLINYEEIELNGLARAVKLRATFRTNERMSPIMSLNDLLLTSFLSELSGSYVSRTIDMSEAEFNTLRVEYQAMTPGNSTVTPRYSVDGGQTWREFTTQPVAEQRTSDFVRYMYEERITEDINGYDSFKIRLDLRTQNSFVRPRCSRLLARVTYE